jgi:acetyl esterase/lipase
LKNLVRKNIIMKPSALFFLFVFMTVSSAVVAQKLADPILLWPEGAPGATGISDEDKPAIIPFFPEQAKRNGAAMLVVPGGGFTIRAVDHEGVLVAQWLRDQGITAFVLRYRLRPLYARNDWVKDGQRAMQLIRQKANTFGISPDRVGAVGFSAGANLIADMTLNPVPGQPSHRPDLMALAYGSMQIPAGTDSATLAHLPPTFMYGTAEDAGTTKGMVVFYTRLLSSGAPVEAHFFQNGAHGSGFALGDPILGEWPKLMHNWMAAHGFLTDKPQLPLTGVVKLDGAPLIKGMVILKPVEHPEAPPVVVYINNTGTGEMGRFSVPKEQGPVAGKYRVEVRQDAIRWTSNSRDPFMIGMMSKQRNNTLTEQDLIMWGEHLRKRDLSPSIDNQRVFVRQRPMDKKDYIIEVKEGNDVLIEIFSK